MKEIYRNINDELIEAKALWFRIDTEWSDEKLHKKYGLTKDEIAFIESKICPIRKSVGDKLSPTETGGCRWKTI